MSQSLETLRKLLRTADEETLSRQEFVSVTKRLIATFSSIADRQDALLDTLSKKVDEAIMKVEAQSKETVDSTSQKLMSQTRGEIAKLQLQFKSFTKSTKDAVQTVLDTVRDGEDADEERIIERLKSLIPEEDIESIKKEHERIMGMIEDLKRVPRRVGGGGITDVGVTFAMGRSVKTETPSGTINGSNKAFTTTQPIQAVFSYMLNGEVVASTNYTIAGNTITWTTAPPSDYSGSDHEIVYI